MAKNGSTGRCASCLARGRKVLRFSLSLIDMGPPRHETRAGAIDLCESCWSDLTALSRGRPYRRHRDRHERSAPALLTALAVM